MSNETFDTVTDLIGIPLAVAVLVMVALIDLAYVHGHRPTASRHRRVWLAISALAVLIVVRFVALA